MRTTLLTALLIAATALAQPKKQPEAQPPVVDSGDSTKAPSDAIVLFNGSGTDEWVHADGRPAEWKVERGALICNSGTGHIYTKRKLGSAQIHLEFSTPNMPEAQGQARGNSGVYLQSRYEIQILDSYQNPTYPNGSAAALYGQYAPLVNASRPPEQWQTYDIVFHAPQCEAGKVIHPGTLTLFHNGVLVQDHVTIKGQTPGSKTEDVCQPNSLQLQDHFHPDVKSTFLKFRNIWARPLTSAAAKN